MPWQPMPRSFANPRVVHGVAVGYHGDTMGAPWYCHDIAMGSTCCRHGVFIRGPGVTMGYHGNAMAARAIVLSNHGNATVTHGNAITMPTTVMALPWCLYGGPWCRQALPWYCRGVHVVSALHCHGVHHGQPMALPTSISMASSLSYHGRPSCHQDLPRNIQPMAMPRHGIAMAMAMSRHVPWQCQGSHAMALPSYFAIVSR